VTVGTVASDCYVVFDIEEVIAVCVTAWLAVSECCVVVVVRGHCRVRNRSPSGERLMCGRC
jgi:hypothetical protein